jgi:LuxR family transcriptional regulator, quorum-sensing system regulator BjaR1
VNPFPADILVEFLSTCDQARNRAELLQCVERVTSYLGLDYVAMAFLPLPHERLDTFFVWQKWPKAWFERYLKLDYFHADPVANLVRQTGKSVIWSKALDQRVLPAKARKIMEEARDFGLVDGLTIPLHSTTSFGGIFSVAGARKSMTPQETKLLELVAERAYDRLNELEWIRHPPGLPPHITRAESECLTLCVAGKTDREIGRLTGRSPRTVQDHIRSLQRKLSAVNRAQLVAEAFRRRLQR